MTVAAAEGAARVLVVGDDDELGAMLHLHLLRAGWSPVCVPSPELVEAIVPIITPHAIVLVLPEMPSANWGVALTASATAAQAGVRVVLVAPSRDVVEPLAIVSGAERALSRAEVLVAPRTVLGAPPARGLPPPIPRRRGGTGAFPVATGTSAARPLPGATTLPAPAPTPPSRTSRGAERSATTLGFGLPPSRTAGGAPPSGRSDDEISDLVRAFVEEPDHTPTPTFIAADVSLVSEHNFFVGRTRRLDSGGLFVAMAHPPPIGTSLGVRLGLPDMRKIEVRGEVLFLRARSAMAGREPAGCGLKLTGMPSWAVDVAERFFVARPPILHQP